MARKRSISTEISTDKRFNQLVNEYGTLAGLLYILIIPHVEDDCTITSDIDELKMKVIPGLRSAKKKDVEKAVQGMLEVGLLYQKFADVLSLPPESFYKYQSYIPLDRRVVDDNAAEHRKTAINPAPLSLSLSPSPSLSPKEYTVAFLEFWKVYPRKADKIAANKAWTARIKDGVSPEAIVKGAEAYAVKVEGTEEKYIKLPATFLNAGSYENDPMTAEERAIQEWVNTP